MLRRSFIKWAAVTLPLPSLTVVGSVQVFTGISLHRRDSVAVKLRCRNNEMRWFIIPVNKTVEGYAWPSMRIPYVVDTIVDLETLEYLKRRDGSIKDEISRSDRRAIAAAPALDRNNMFDELNKVSYFQFREARWHVVEQIAEIKYNQRAVKQAQRI
jgi:hypothetical protein